MRHSTIGIVSAAVLMVAAGAGSGIAQAGGSHSDRPVSSFEDQLYAGEESPSADGVRLTMESGEFVPEGNWSGTDWQGREPVETGAIPVTGPEEPWMKDYGQD
jgi:hypothetical protein